MCAHSRNPNKNPIGLRVLWNLWQEVRLRVVLSQLFGNLIVAIAPTKIPWPLPVLLIYATVGHPKSIEDAVKPRFVRKELAIKFLVVCFKVIIDVLKVPVVKDINGCPVNSTVRHNHWPSSVGVFQIEFIGWENFTDIKGIHVTAEGTVGWRTKDSGETIREGDGALKGVVQIIKETVVEGCFRDMVPFLATPGSQLFERVESRQWPCKSTTLFSDWLLTWRIITFPLRLE